MAQLEKKIIIVSIVADIIGLVSVVLGYFAEVTKTRPADLNILLTGGCMHQHSPAFEFAIGAAFLLLLAQTIVSAFIGCGLFRQNGQMAAGLTPTVANQERKSRSTACLMYSISWVAFAISFTMFLRGAAIESKGYNGDVVISCALVRRGGFLSAAMLALATFNLSIGAYIILNYYDPGTKTVDGIAMGYSSSLQSNGTEQCQQGVPAQEKPVNHGQQYCPPGTTHPGYEHNTQSV